ncbi:hypothetical protein BaRGS_00024220 [Batillaria attramentaria]|uniref:ABC transporter n=1 Tax=Batillaria attramentaria TaxID=370345 RepID=A0ABD0KBV6_9CAEN
MLHGKTRIIVTQNWQCLRTADRIAILREGSLYDVGSLEDLQARGVDVREFVNSDLSQRRAQVEAEEEHFHVQLKLLRQTSETQEERTKQTRSDVSTFFAFLTGSRVWILLLFVLLLWLGSQALTSWSDWMLACWIVGDGTAANTSAAAVVASGDQPLSYLYQASTPVNGPHVNMPVNTAESSSSWRLFERYTVGLGEIVSVFAQHLWFIDTHVPQLAYLSTEMTLRVVAMAVVMCVISPWLVLPVLLLVVIMATLQVVSGRALQGVRSFRESARAPVYTDIAETLKGLQTIRSYRRHDHFLQGFDSHLNSLTWARFLGLCAFSQLTLVSMLLAVIFSSTVVYVGVSLTGQLHSGLLGLVLTYCVILLMPLHLLLQQSVALGNQMASVDRAVSLAQQDQEPAWFSDKPPPADWPNRGSITFSRTSLLVGPDGPFIVRDIDVHVKSKEKVGVVGELGSGKYSLMSVMMRLQHVQGMIFIDGFDVLKIGLHELRRNILVVPQEPVLFPGTLRDNLDPGGEYTDEELWTALDKMGLRDRVAGIRGGLSVDVSGDTAIFSLGQRQLICLVRGMLKKTKIILFEEAVDATDQGLTDQIQRTLRAKFRDCTVLVVAHRLASVFNRGEVREFDTPYALLQQENGHFTRLVDQSGKRQSQQLRAMAELSHQHRASQSLMLEHAVFMATEQLHASTEDLTFRPGSLAWSHMAKFAKSQDSLEKVHSDWGSRGDVREDEDMPSPGGQNSKGRQLPSLAPAQKIINRRKSPNRGKRYGGGGVEGEKDNNEEEGEKSRPGAEQMPLLSYDAPPRPAAHQRASYEKKSGSVERRNDRDDGGRSTGRDGDRRNKGGSTSPLLDSSQRRDLRPTSSQNSPARVNAAPGGHRVRGTEVLETAIDTPPSGRKTFPPPLSSTGDSSRRGATGRDAAPTARGATHTVPPARVVYSREPRGRLISGEYSPPAQSGKEDTERIIYC